MFGFSALCDIFVCASNISGTAEWICAKFIRMTCLVPRSGEFERQDERSEVKVIRDKNGKTAESSPLTMHCNACAVRCKPRATGDGTIVSQPGVTG